MGAVVLPGLAVDDITRMEQAVWPFRVGGQLVHRDWQTIGDLDHAVIHVIKYNVATDEIDTTSGSGSHVMKYRKTAFEPIEGYWFYRNGKRTLKKSGFGKWFAEKRDDNGE